MLVTCLARGSKWGSASLYDGWGDCGGREEEIGNLVVEMFHSLCRRRVIDATWVPETSEVIGGIGQYRWGQIDEDLEEMREQAQEMVWDAVCGSKTLASERVENIFKRW